MKPYQEEPLALSAALLDGPGTTRELALRTGCAITPARKALTNMGSAGDACRCGSKIACRCSRKSACPAS